MPDLLHFFEPRILEPAWPDHLDVPWLDYVGPSDDDRPQLEAILRLYDPHLTGERLLHATARELFTSSLEGFEEEPIEIWDIIDDDSYVRFTLWMFLASQGVLFEAGSTRVIGEVIHGAFYGDEEALDFEARELTEQLHRAQKHVRGEYPKSSLASVVFVRSFTY